MGKSRLEAFSDGVLAIIITIMVLELKVPHGAGLEELTALWPKFASYVLSFVYVGIYWNNHHHLLHTIRNVNGAELWANLHLLFWLSLMPFATEWMGENHFAVLPMAFYGLLLLLCAIAFTVLTLTMVRREGTQSVLAHALGADVKGKVSLALYAAGIALCFVNRALAGACYVTVALIWLIPDRRVERALIQHAVRE